MSAKILSLVTVLLFISLFSTTAVRAKESFSPFILAYQGEGDFSEKVREVKRELKDNDFKIVGEYKPNNNTHLLIVTNTRLKKVAARSKLGGFAATVRISVNKVGNEIQVSYVNPEYIASAYRLRKSLSEVSSDLTDALGQVKPFGSKALSRRELSKYSYTFGMERFTDIHQLAQYGSFQEAVSAVEKSLSRQENGVSKIYRLDIPGKQVAIYGISISSTGEGDHLNDAYLLSKVDSTNLKQSAYLPYQIMIIGNQVVALHMRFRFPLHFPGIKMTSRNYFPALMQDGKPFHKKLAKAIGN